MKIKALVHEAAEGGFWTEVPALPGCVTQGETIAEVQANLSDAIPLWLEASADAPSDSVVQVARRT